VRPERRCQAHQADAPQRSKLRTKLDDVACKRRHQNHDGLHVVVLFDLRGLILGRPRMTAEVRMRRRDVAARVHGRARCRHHHGALVVALRDLTLRRAPASRDGDRGSESSRPRRMRAPSPESPRSTPGRPPRPPWPHPEGHSASDGWQRRGRRRSCSVSSASSPRCALPSPSGSTRRWPPDGLGSVRSAEPSRRSRMRTSSPEPPRSTPGRPLRHPPDHPEHRSRIGCIAATSQEEIGLDLIVIIIVVCSRFISGDSTASSTRCIPRRLTRSRRRRAR
jgi:hypothetical protein